MPEPKTSYKEDDFVAKVVRDPKNPPSTILLSAFLGKSSEAGHVRLYLNEELSDYLDVPESAVLHSQEMSKEESPLGGSYVWIQRDAQLLQGAATASRTTASFLEGRIQRQYIPQPVIGPALPRPFTTTDPTCTDVGPRCPTTVGPRCTQFGPRCRTDFLPCPTDIGPAPLCPDTVSDPRCQPTTVPDPRCPIQTETGPRCTRFGPVCRTDFLPCPTEVGPRCTRFGPQCPTVPRFPC